MLKLLTELADERYTAIENLLKEKGFDMREVERRFLLLTVDKHWMDHIDAMDQLREGIGLRAMGNQDPVVQYRNEGFDMFETMTAEIRNETVMNLYHPVIRVPERRQPDTMIAPECRQPGKSETVPRCEKNRTERPLSLRQRQKIQKMLRKNRRLITEARVSPKLDRNPRSRFKLF